MKVIVNDEKYYLVDVSFVKGIITEGKHQGERHTANRALFNYIEESFRTKQEAKKHMQRNGLQPLKERKLAKYATTAYGHMMVEDRKRFGITQSAEYPVVVDTERTGWTILSGFDLYLYWKDTMGFSIH